VKPGAHKQSNFVMLPLQAPVQIPITFRAPVFNGQVTHVVVPVSG
jgi:hypothetical protein